MMSTVKGKDRAGSEHDNEPPRSLRETQGSDGPVQSSSISRHLITKKASRFFRKQAPSQGTKPTPKILHGREKEDSSNNRQASSSQSTVESTTDQRRSFTNLVKSSFKRIIKKGQGIGNPPDRAAPAPVSQERVNAWTDFDPKLVGRAVPLRPRQRYWAANEPNPPMPGYSLRFDQVTLSRIQTHALTLEAKDAKLGRDTICHDDIWPWWFDMWLEGLVDPTDMHDPFKGHARVPSLERLSSVQEVAADFAEEVGEEMAAGVSICESPSTLWCSPSTCDGCHRRRIRVSEYGPPAEWRDNIVWESEERQEGL